METIEKQTWPETLAILPVTRSLVAEIQPPGSKSISNRALLCAALASGQSNLIGIADCEDTRLMSAALGECGAAISGDWDQAKLQITGMPRDWALGVSTPSIRPTASGLIELYVGNSGTTIRFLAAALAARGGGYRLSGVDRMHERPIGDLIEALSALGANVTTESASGFPPVLIESIGIRGGRIEVRGDRSSQFLSGLMMAAPLARESVELVLQGPLVSKPYIEMTIAVMKSFGCEVQVISPGEAYRIEPQDYTTAEYLIEPDASGASYFFAAAAICGGQVTVRGLNRQSLQGDIRFVECLQQMGCHVSWDPSSITVSGKAQRGIDCDMSDISDTVQTLAVVSLFVDGATRIRGVGHNRLKETDRIGNFAIELRKLGASVDEHQDGLTISPQPLHGASLATWNDHRMAMSLALVGLKVPGVEIKNPGCVVKTYPNFFRDLEHVARSGR